MTKNVLFHNSFRRHGSFIISCKNRSVSMRLDIQVWWQIRSRFCWTYSMFSFNFPCSFAIAKIKHRGKQSNERQIHYHVTVPAAQNVMGSYITIYL